jgi:parvulin-like peptidyl-prolyl isomerase
VATIYVTARANTNVAANSAIVVTLQPSVLPATPTRVMTPTPLPTSTPLPTPTTSPFAVRINGVGITKARVNDELRRQIAANPDQYRTDSKEYAQLVNRLRESVIDTMIEQSLMMSVAKQNNINVSAGELEKALQDLITARGGNDKFEAWLTTFKLTNQDINDILYRQLLTQKVRNWALKDTPTSAEYIRVWHILMASEADAKRLLARLQKGEDFETLAQANSLDITSRGSGGDLGWVARDTGVILWSEVEEAAYKLPINQLSNVVRSPVGFHILRVTGREIRELTPDDFAKLQQGLMKDWMNKLKTSAKIEKFN